MSSVYKVSCDCGYTKDPVEVGRVMGSPKMYSIFPYYCPKCKILFEDNIFSEAEIVCPECGTNDVINYSDERVCKLEKNEYYELNEFTRRRSFSSGKCLCPACGKFNLVFDHYLSYD